MIEKRERKMEIGRRARGCERLILEGINDICRYNLTTAQGTAASNHQKKQFYWVCEEVTFMPFVSLI